MRRINICTTCLFPESSRDSGRGRRRSLRPDKGPGARFHFCHFQSAEIGSWYTDNTPDSFDDAIWDVGKLTVAYYGSSGKDTCVSGNDPRNVDDPQPILVNILIYLIPLFQLFLEGRLFLFR